MVFEVVITTMSQDNKFVGQAIAELSELPSPEQVELLCQLVMANAKYAIAVVHCEDDPSWLYGVIVESADNG